MKRLILSSSIILFIILLGIGSLLLLNAACKDTIEMVATAQDAIDRLDQEAALQSAQELETYWDQHEVYLSLVVRHNDVEELSKYISELSSLMEHEEYGTCAAMLDRIELTAKHIIESETPTPLHIF